MPTLEEKRRGVVKKVLELMKAWPDPRKEMEKVQRSWSEWEPLTKEYPGLERFLRRLFRAGGIRYGGSVLFLGPYRKGIVEAVKKSGWFGKMYLLDATPRMLERGKNVYRMPRLRAPQEILDEFVGGVWHLLLGKDLKGGTIVTYEFTPFITSKEGRNRILKLLQTDLVYMFQHTDNFDYPFSWIEGFLGKLHSKGYLRLKVRYNNDHGIVALVVKPSETLKKAAQIFNQIVHTTQYRPPTGEHVYWALDRLIRLKARNKEEYRKIWEILWDVLVNEKF